MQNLGGPNKMILKGHMLKTDRIHARTDRIHNKVKYQYRRFLKSK